MIVPFEPAHMADLLPRLNREQTLDPETWTPDFCATLAKTTETYSVLAEDGRVVAVCGGMQLWPERYHLFAFMSRDSGRHMLEITRGTQRYMAALRGRIEAEVSEGFDAGHKWLRILGFQCDTPNGLEWFFPGKRRGFMYSKVQS